MEFGVLGPLTIVREGAEVELSAKQRALVAVLLSRAGRRVSDGLLADAVWGPAPPSASTVRWHVHQVRQRLGGDRISRDGDGYLVAVRPHELDALRFEELCDLAGPAASAGDHRAAARLYGEALACWRGDAYDGLDGLREEAARLERLRVSACEGRAEALIALDRPARAAAELAPLVAAYPLDERLRALQVHALHRSGRRAEALTAYHEGRELLVAELGLEPGRHLREAHARVLGDEERAVPSRPHQLPPDVTAFTGREHELAVLDRCLGDGAVAVVTGPGGVGKTGLAVHWAHTRAARFPDGQLYADLRGQAGPLPPEEVLGRFLRALGVLTVPDGPEERAALYRTLLRERRMLVLLDNAAGAAQVRPLLPGSPGCGVVVTGRGAFDGLVAGQGARPVQLGVLPPAQAATLLRRVIGPPTTPTTPVGSISSAGAGGVEGALVELAALCDGLPLALRIAGARLATRPGWTAAGLAARLRRERGRLDELQAGDLDVRASFALSHRELGERERLLFGLLGLLPPVEDFAPWIAAALLDTSFGEAGRLLERLADAQLVQRHRVDEAGQERYRFHDLIRLYAAERGLAELPERERRAALVRAIGGLLGLSREAYRREYRGHFRLTHADAPIWRAAPDDVETLLGGDPIVWLDCERGTLVRAVSAAAGLGESGLCWDLAITGVRLFEVRGYLDLWLSTARVALDACRLAGDRAGEAGTLGSLGAALVFSGRHAEARAFLERSLPGIEGPLVPLVRANLAGVHRHEGREEQALACYEDAVTRARASGDLMAQALIMTNLASMHEARGRPDLADELASEALAASEGIRRARVVVTGNQAVRLMRRGRHEEAVELLDATLAGCRAMGDRLHEWNALFWQAEPLAALGRTAAAEEALTAALRLAELIADTSRIGRARDALRRLRD